MVYKRLPAVPICRKLGATTAPQGRRVAADAALSRDWPACTPDEPGMDQSGRRDVTPERRRLPGAIGYLWCRQCKARFVVAGRRRGRRDTPAIELVVCPECRAARRMVLPPEVGAPFRIVTPKDRTREEQAP